MMLSVQHDLRIVRGAVKQLQWTTSSSKSSSSTPMDCKIGVRVIYQSSQGPISFLRKLGYEWMIGIHSHIRRYHAETTNYQTLGRLEMYFVSEFESTGSGFAVQTLSVWTSSCKLVSVWLFEHLSFVLCVTMYIHDTKSISLLVWIA